MNRALIPLVGEVGDLYRIKPKYLSLESYESQMLLCETQQGRRDVSQRKLQDTPDGQNPACSCNCSCVGACVYMSVCGGGAHV